MPIDWGATGSMLEGIGTIGGVGAVVWGALRATATWKAQKQAEHRLESAKQILTATHKAKTALGYVRGVMMWGHELAAAEAKLKEDPEWKTIYDGAKKKRLITAQAFYNRLNNVKAEMAALDDCLPMARALFGEELENVIAKLRHQFWLVQVDVDCYVDVSDEDVDEDSKEFKKKLRRGMYDVAPRGEANERTNIINEAVASIEHLCVPTLRLDPPPKPLPSADG